MVRIEDLRIADEAHAEPLGSPHAPDGPFPSRRGHGAGGRVKRILVVCYSRTGHCRKLAEAIARRCDADLEVIRERDNRHGLIGCLKSFLQALLHRKPWIQPARRSPGDYSLVVIGTPVWAWTMASPVRSYLARHGERCRRVAFFCTGSGHGAGKALADMQKLCGKRALATLSLPPQRVAAGVRDGDLEPFVRRIQGTRSAGAGADSRWAA